MGEGISLTALNLTSLSPTNLTRPPRTQRITFAATFNVATIVPMILVHGLMPAVVLTTETTTERIRVEADHDLHPKNDTDENRGQDPSQDPSQDPDLQRNEDKQTVKLR